MKPDLELLFEVSAQLEPPVPVGNTPDGFRRVIPILGGTFVGPRMKGTLLPGGADWQLFRPDGVAVVEALYLLRTDDGVTIQVRNRGMRHGPEAVMQRLAAGDPVDPTEYYFRALPAITAPAGRYEWLNRSLFVCSGARMVDSVRLWFYQIL
jgi:hypothetical protein